MKYERPQAWRFDRAGLGGFVCGYPGALNFAFAVWADPFRLTEGQVVLSDVRAFSIPCPILMALFLDCFLRISICRGVFGSE